MIACTARLDSSFFSGTSLLLAVAVLLLVAVLPAAELDAVAGCTLRHSKKSGMPRRPTTQNSECHPYLVMMVGESVSPTRFPQWKPVKMKPRARALAAGEMWVATSEFMEGSTTPSPTPTAHIARHSQSRIYALVKQAGDQLQGKRSHLEIETLR